MKKTHQHDAWPEPPAGIARWETCKDLVALDCHVETCRQDGCESKVIWTLAPWFPRVAFGSNLPWLRALELLVAKTVPSAIQICNMHSINMFTHTHDFPACIYIYIYILYVCVLLNIPTYTYEFVWTWGSHPKSKRLAPKYHHESLIFSLGPGPHRA